MRKELYIISLIFLLPGSLAFSQNTGFGGKRVLLKTDVLNGVRSPFFSITGELLIARRFTLSAGYRATTGKYNQIYFMREYKTQDDSYSYSYNNSDYLPNKKLKDKATVTSRTLSVEARYYRSSVIAAPKGCFFYGTFNYGSVDITKGNYTQSLVEDMYIGSSYSYGSGNYKEDTYYTYEAKGIRTWGLEAGWGYQSFINKYLTLGFKLGLNKTYFNANTKYDEAIMSGVAKTYGPNLLRLSPLDFSILGTSDQEQDGKIYKGSMGLAFYLQLGILLF
jgi:hypothetical protein